MTRRPVTHVLDPMSRRWWRAVGRRVDPSTPEFAFLAAPHNERHEIGDAWLHDYEKQGMVAQPSPTAGLFDDMAVLDGPDFHAADLHPAVRDFYEQTGAWRMEVWSQWNPLFAPGGMAVAALFGRRVEQLALPTEPLSVSRGMSSEVRIVSDESGRRQGAAWLRRLRLDDSAVYSGFYRSAVLPGRHQPHVAVSFPLELGNIHVFLAPRAEADGALTLTSRSQRFGEDGAYVSVLFGDEWYAAQPPLRESFRVYVDDEGVLRTDHELKVGRFRALRLHYRLERHS
ncbi:hypothetical protein [Gordonia sp. (in: high G+C Gram-positive bacteria)]|uniref:hypothetical protein n=1 Tax=Gordonia sp. (in: high G+C Gram-positive bacteria) TaxID=84139 RepID=UPI00169ED0C5|nr:hypothetical protein [Gordonia sp. (in: high G+C Gram-positive bacteria)]NLG47872.1 hypothetical protein [Gordonia sp. (in: high G+C Gram-positive bacteria)]